LCSLQGNRTRGPKALLLTAISSARSARVRASSLQPPQSLIVLIVHAAHGTSCHPAASRAHTLLRLVVSKLTEDQPTVLINNLYPKYSTTAQQLGRVPPVPSTSLGTLDPLQPRAQDHNLGISLEGFTISSLTLRDLVRQIRSALVAKRCFASLAANSALAAKEVHSFFIKQVAILYN